MLNWTLLDDFPEVENLAMMFDLRLKTIGGHLLDDRKASGTTDVRINRVTNQISFKLDFEYLEVIYGRVIPLIRAYIGRGDGIWERWEHSTLFGLSNNILSETTIILPIEVDGIQTRPTSFAIWRLIPEVYHFGKRGILPSDNASRIELGYEGGPWTP